MINKFYSNNKGDGFGQIITTIILIVVILVVVVILAVIVRNLGNESAQALDANARGIINAIFNAANNTGDVNIPAMSTLK